MDSLDLIFDEMTERVMQLALVSTMQFNSEYVTPEHILYAAVQEPVFCRAFQSCGGNVERLRSEVLHFIENDIPKTPEVNPAERNMGDWLSEGVSNTVALAVRAAGDGETDKVKLHHILWAMSKLKASHAVYFIESQVDYNDLLAALQLLVERGNAEEEEFVRDVDDPEEFLEDYAVCLNDLAGEHAPLIGREKEIERLIRILLRKEKNNPLLIGEPGVGKTSIVYGFVDRLVRGDVPEGLKGERVYRLDVAEVLAGTQYRGDFEQRFLDILDAFTELGNPIIFVDEIHTLVGAGAMGSGSMDASNMLKKYLEEGNLRFVGTTGYAEYKKSFEKNTAFSRRFQNIDVKEPSEEEAVSILEGLRKRYEKFHGVHYGKDVLSYAVKLSKEHIGGRFLPDKAIDLMDEAGAYRRMHPMEGQKRQTVGRDVIETVLSELGNIPKQTAESSEVDRLKALYGNITSKIFGQEEAVRRIVDAICMSRAGLLSENKPIASFLFVGPTGVGKTEVAKVLAKELGIGFNRFDMSEYAEKHTVSKLIGSPAGYVGYDDGGLLTDAIRKTPHCVLLLDEIEKAHPDIFNVLLQVMDYAQLTDSRGQKADFKNVIIIMTSNAGARMIGRQSIGYGAATFNDGVMMEEVKRVFTPEFRNRLSAVVTFNHMSDRMAAQIAEKKLGELSELLRARNVTMETKEAALEYIRRKGITREYGAREIERVIDSEIKPLFVQELLFGKLAGGGEAVLDMKDGKPLVGVKKKLAGSAGASKKAGKNATEKNAKAGGSAERERKKAKARVRVPRKES